MNASEEWTRCRPWIEAALEYADGAMLIEDVEENIRNGKYQFWPGFAAAAITEIAIYPRKRHLLIVLAGGDMEEIIAMFPSMKSFGCFHGCEKLVEAGRTGWERVLGRRGWRRECVVLSTPIEALTNGKPIQ